MARRPPLIPAFQELVAQFVGGGLFEEAIAAIDSALALAPRNVNLRLDLGFLHLERNDRGKARRFCSRLPHCLSSSARRHLGLRRAQIARSRGHVDNGHELAPRPLCCERKDEL
ncbi:tetratricopeptide repeat protein [Bradyrhizobium sp. Ec3.3]|uniref:tetratricopeptide repeat protein n=1 Tax=Bradyrhizobium sp. Ec3.3 TaxID=189753 RepID=UPI003527D6F0